MATIRSTTRGAVLGCAAAAAVAVLMLAIPLYVIRPFRPQGARALAVALEVRVLGPWVAALCAVAILVMLVRVWRRARIAAQAFLVLCLLVAVAMGAATRVNIFEKMFHPYAGPVFGTASEAGIEADDKVLSLTIGGETHAFPVRTMGYHHIVNDTLAGVPIAATYCTLCHTGVIYDRRLDGRTLWFELAGINNGNALLRDRETGSVWQQSTGEAIFGALKGRVLTVLPSDELTFALWREERPGGLVLKPDRAYAAAYDPKDWEAHVARTPVTVDTRASGIDPHALMFGVSAGGEFKAYPVAAVLPAKIVEDRLGGQPLLLVVGPDGVSVRVFRARVGEGTLSMLPGAEGTMVDRGTGSAWNFSGCAVTGALAGQCMGAVEAHQTFWFDWVKHHPGTKMFRG